jgi:hypothetical protein
MKADVMKQKTRSSKTRRSLRHLETEPGWLFAQHLKQTRESGTETVK